MFSHLHSSFNRRIFSRTALMGAASAFLAVDSSEAQRSDGHEIIDARRFGATGDGKTDDTAALQRAIDTAGEKTGSVVVPPGIYLTGELHLREGVALSRRSKLELFIRWRVGSAIAEHRFDLPAGLDGCTRCHAAGAFAGWRKPWHEYPRHCDQAHWIWQA